MLGKINKAPLTSLRKLFSKFDFDKQQRLNQINLISPGMYIKGRLMLTKCTSNTLFLRKITSYDTILAFFEAIKTDNVLSQRIIGVLPHEIHQVYL